MRVVPAICVVFLSACGPSIQAGDGEPAVTLAVEPTAVAAGDSVVLTLTNQSPRRVGYNLCTSALEVREGAAWEPVPSDRVCTMELRILEPDRMARYAMDLPAGLTPGQYRFVTTVEYLEPGERVRLLSDPFTVGR